MADKPIQGALSDERIDEIIGAHVAELGGVDFHILARAIESEVRSAVQEEAARHGDGAPYGYLYDWTHSSALGRPDEEFTGFVKTFEEAVSGVGHRNVRAIYLAAAPGVQAAPQGDSVTMDRQTIENALLAAQGLCDGQALTANSRHLINRAISSFSSQAALQGADTGLRRAAQAVLDRWNSPKWEWHQQGPTADLMHALHDALRAPSLQAGDAPSGNDAKGVV